MTNGRAKKSCLAGSKVDFQGFIPPTVSVLATNFLLFTCLLGIAYIVASVFKNAKLTAVKEEQTHSQIKSQSLRDSLCPHFENNTVHENRTIQPLRKTVLNTQLNNYALNCSSIIFVWSTTKGSIK